MARNYKPAAPFTTPMKLLIPTKTVVKGVVKKGFSDPESSSLFFGSFRTFGGAESITNDVYTVIDTGTIDTWYRPDIKSDCAVYIISTGETWQIVSTPENINMRNQYLHFRVKRVGGGA